MKLIFHISNYLVQTFQYLQNKRKNITFKTSKIQPGLVHLLPHQVYWIIWLIYMCALGFVLFAVHRLAIPLLFVSLGVYLFIGSAISFYLGFIYFHSNDEDQFSYILLLTVFYSMSLIYCLWVQYDALSVCHLRQCKVSDMNNLEEGISVCLDIFPLMFLMSVNCFATFICLCLDKNERSFPRNELAECLLPPQPILYAIFSIGAFTGSFGDLHTVIISLNRPVSLLTGILCVDYSCRLIKYQMKRKGEYQKQQLNDLKNGETRRGGIRAKSYESFIPHDFRETMM